MPSFPKAQEYRLISKRLDLSQMQLKHIKIQRGNFKHHFHIIKIISKYMKHGKPKLLILKFPLILQTTTPLFAKIFSRSKTSTEENTLKLDPVEIKKEKTKESTQKQVELLFISSYELPKTRSI